MIWTARTNRSAVRARSLTTIVAACLTILGFANGNAQIMVSRPPSFQAVSQLSLTNQILDRVAVTGQYQPEDLANMTRLMFLESIAMQVDVREDLAGTPVGNRLGSEVASLSDASAQFNQSVDAAPSNRPSFARSSELFDAMEANYRQVESTLGELPGLSNPAAAHLRRVRQLLTPVTSIMQGLEAEFSPPNPVAPKRSIALISVQRKARLLAIDLVELIRKFDHPSEKRSGRQGLPEDLDGLLAGVRDLDRQLSLQDSHFDIRTSVETLRERVWRVEANISQLDWPAEFHNAWRVVRGRMNAISDDLGLPRVMRLGKSVAVLDRPNTVMLERPSPRVFRGAPTLRSGAASEQ